MINGFELLESEAAKLELNFASIIARTTIWADPATVNAITNYPTNGFNKNAEWVLNCRRYRSGESRRNFGSDGFYLDGNSIANKAIKKATGEVAEQGTFTACHIYDTKDNPNHHTSIRNLVLVPNALSTLTDHDDRVKSALRYKAYELYGFTADHIIPSKPKYYNLLDWRKPEPFSPKIEASIKRRKHKYLEG